MTAALIAGAVAGSAGEGCGPLQHTQLQHPPEAFSCFLLYLAERV